MSGPVTETIDPDFSTDQTVGAILSPGTVIGDRYEVQQVLGQGGFATVYAVHDRQLDNPVSSHRLLSRRAERAPYTGPLP